MCQLSHWIEGLSIRIARTLSGGQGLRSLVPFGIRIRIIIIASSGLATKMDSYYQDCAESMGIVSAHQAQPHMLGKRTEKSRLRRFRRASSSVLHLAESGMFLIIKALQNQTGNFR
jgi:hypothetical protein